MIHHHIFGILAVIGLLMGACASGADLDEVGMGEAGGAMNSGGTPSGGMMAGGGAPEGGSASMGGTIMGGGMASGGMGDVLSGVIAALMAQGLPAIDAAVFAAVLHARAADEAAHRGGERGLLAGDLLAPLRRLVDRL